MAVLFLCAQASPAQQDTTETEAVKKHENTGFMDFNGYYDTRSYSVLTINLLANLPCRFQYFSLTNFTGKQPDAFESETFYSEQNLRWAIHREAPVDLTYQYVMRQGGKNDDHRFGLRWRLHNTPGLDGILKKLSTSVSVNPFFFQFRTDAEAKYMTHIEYVYRISFWPDKLDRRVYLAGFADQNLSYPEGGKVKVDWVTEHQLGIRIINELYVILEYRINNFLADEQRGLGYGLQYKAVF